jgi:putative transposase
VRKTRNFIENGIYHVTSRTNNKVRAFESAIGKEILLMIFKRAKKKYGFTLYTFCIMPTHFHLLIKPLINTNLSIIMQWIKTNSAKRWNSMYNCENHLWGERFFADEIKDEQAFNVIYNYIEQNPVKAGFVLHPTDWEASGAYHIYNNIQGLVDYTHSDRQKYVKSLDECQTP